MDIKKLSKEAVRKTTKLEGIVTLSDDQLRQVVGGGGLEGQVAGAQHGAQHQAGFCNQQCDGHRPSLRASRTMFEMRDSSSSESPSS